MKSGQPPLLETSDPAELLGIHAGASLRDVKQAYARLIKLYRPERAPQEFQRIHAAFEELSRRLAGGYGHLPAREFRSQRVAQHAPAQAATEAGKTAAERAPDSAQLQAETFATRVQGGASVQELASIWASGIDRDLDLVAVMFELSPPAVLTHLADAGHFAWPRLAARSFPFRGALWTLHAQTRLAQRRCEELLAEAQSESFREAAEDDEHMREALWLPLTVAAWDQPFSVFEPFTWAMDGQELSAGAKTFHQACQLREQLKRVDGWRWLPPGFSELIRFGRVSPELRHELLLSLKESLDSRPQSWWRLCEQLSHEQKLLGFYLLATLAMQGLTNEAPLGALPQRQRELLELSIKDARSAPRSLSYSWTSNALMVSVLLCIVLICVLVHRAYQAAFGTGAARALLPPLEWLLGTIVILVVLARVQTGLQDRFARGTLRTDLAGTGIGYQQLVDALAASDTLKPKTINSTALKIYMTLNLAVHRSLRAPSRSGNSVSSYTP